MSMFDKIKGMMGVPDDDDYDDDDMDFVNENTGCLLYTSRCV